MAGSSPNFYHWYKDTWHNTQVFDLTYFSRSQRSKFKTYYKVDLVLLLFVWFDILFKVTEVKVQNILQSWLGFVTIWCRMF
jgi:hypothetical protein